MLIKAKTIQLHTAEKVQLFDLTNEVKGFLAETGIWNGREEMTQELRDWGRKDREQLPANGGLR